MSQVNLDGLKRAAKRLVRASSSPGPGALTHTQALERLSHEAGWRPAAGNDGLSVGWEAGADARQIGRVGAAVRA